jgi:hypothetical protein
MHPGSSILWIIFRSLVQLQNVMFRAWDIGFILCEVVTMQLPPDLCRGFTQEVWQLSFRIGESASLCFKLAVLKCFTESSVCRSPARAVSTKKRSTNPCAWDDCIGWTKVVQVPCDKITKSQNAHICIHRASQVVCLLAV